MQRQEGRKRSTLSIQTEVQDVCRLGLRDGEDCPGEDREAGSCRAWKHFQE